MFRGLSNAHMLAAARWLPITNSTGSAIPEFSLVRVTASSTSGVFTAAQPNADGGMVWATGPGEIPAGETGIATPDFPAYVAYDSGDGTPAVGETWGAENGSWKLNKNKAGFRVCGTPDTSLVIVPVERDYTVASGTTITVREVDGSPSYSSVATLEFDSAFSFVVSQPGAGIARVRLDSASASAPGIVSLGAQNLGNGTKTVDDLVANNTIEAPTVTGDSVIANTGMLSPFFDVDAGGTGYLVNSVTRIDGSGYFLPVSSTDAAAPNNSIYYSTTASKLVYKDSGGTVNNLY